ncbi:hypothetical protein NC652_028869 [Populus alba x Populus x berolinensis]|nr:hypothetical protein NC652_028869 [Populus alba x Populus x berolinensis]
MWPCSHVENIIDWNRGFKICGRFNGLSICCNCIFLFFNWTIGIYLKQALYELVILPLRKPELLSHEKLLGPQKGVLLYGPPGTGKTILAKAIIREFGAVFINMRISNLMSKWFGDAKKLACDVINPDHIDVEFELIGGLESIKQALYELVILHLRKPELFSHEKLLGPQKGSFMSCKLPELLYFTCKYCYCCDCRICQSSILLNLQELLQFVHNSITFKILPETEIDLSDHE